MKKYLYITLFAAAALSIVGCDNGASRRNYLFAAFRSIDSPLQPQEFGKKFRETLLLDQENGHPTGIQLLFNQYKCNRNKKAAGEDLPNYDAVQTDLRNRIVFQMMTLIEHYHEGTTTDVYEITAELETLFDFAGLAVGGAGAVAGDASFKAAMNAIGAGLIGARTSMSKNILAEQTKFALVLQMEALWENKKADIISHITDSKNTDKLYSLENATTDLYNYFSAGSLKQAVAEMVKTAQEKKNAADKKLDSAQKNTDRSSATATAP